MTIPALGFEERLGFALEAHDDYGTLVSPTNALRYEQFGVRPVFRQNSVPGIHGPVAIYRGTAADNPRVVASSRKVEGPWNWPFEFIESMIPIYNLLCKDDGAGNAVGYSFAAGFGPDGAQAGTNRHIFQMQNHNQDCARALSLVRFNGQRQDSFLGCYLRSLDLVMAQPGAFMWNADILGQNISKGTAETIPAFTSSPFARIHEMRLDFSTTVGAARGTLTSYGNIQSANCQTSHNLREIEGTGRADSAIRQPIPGDFSAVTGQFATDWESDTWQDVWDAASGAGSFVCMEFRITSGINHAGGSPFVFIIRIPAALIVGEYPAHGGGPGAIPQAINYEAAVFDTGGSEQTVSYEFYSAEGDLGL